MRIPKVVRGVGLVLVAFALGGCGDQSSGDSAPSARLVESAPVRPAGGERTVSLSGRLRAAERAALSFELSGEIASLEVDVGDPIEKGQTLASLRAERYHLVLQRAQAEAAQAQAALEEKRLDLQRQRRLREQGVGSAADLDAAQAAFSTAQSRRQAARASVNIAERDVSLTQLKAPFSGSVSRRLAEPAQRVSPKEPVLEAISGRGGFEVSTHVPEALVAQIEKGTSHPVRVAALGSQPLRGRVEHIGTQPQSSSNYPLILRLESADPRLRGGMTAQVLLQTSDDAPPQAWLVPLTALVHGASGDTHVYTVDSQHRVVAVPISVLAPRETQALITGPLERGQRVIARGGEFVQPGDKVTLLEEGPQRFN